MGTGNIIPRILEILQIQAEVTIDLLDALTSNYTDSRRKAWGVSGFGSGEFEVDWADWYRKRQSFYSLLNHLKNQGLVKKETIGYRKSIWKITRKGLEKLKIIKRIEKPSKIYKSEAGNKFKVIIFDIPEKEKEKRVWVREILKILGFTMLQKSVWIGKNKIPARFLFELKNREMMDYVHVFEINQKGSIGFYFQ